MYAVHIIQGGIYMRVNTNLAAQTIFTQYTGKYSKASESDQRLSFQSAAGLEIFEKMRARIRNGSEKASSNAQDSILKEKPP
jgi:flagellin-like hook-associated protein FlgL